MATLQTEQNVHNLPLLLLSSSNIVPINAFPESSRHAGLIQGKAKDFHLPVIFQLLFTRVQGKKKEEGSDIGCSYSSLPAFLSPAAYQNEGN